MLWFQQSMVVRARCAAKGEDAVWRINDPERAADFLYCHSYVDERNWALVQHQQETLAPDEPPAVGEMRCWSKNAAPRAPTFGSRWLQKIQSGRREEVKGQKQSFFVCLFYFLANCCVSIFLKYIWEEGNFKTNFSSFSGRWVLTEEKSSTDNKYDFPSSKQQRTLEVTESHAKLCFRWKRQKSEITFWPINVVINGDNFTWTLWIITSGWPPPRFCLCG